MLSAGAMFGLIGCTEVALDQELTCDDGADNDGDGQIDCDDVDCDALVICNVVEDCANGADDDGDAAIDCDDTDCADSVACFVEGICDDNQDNDSDGQVDCNDVDCNDFVGCQDENCFDGVDNNGDGAADCGTINGTDIFPPDPLCAANCADACTDAPSFTLALNNFIDLPASNFGRQNDNAGSCQAALGGGVGPEVAFRVTTADAGTLIALVSSPQADFGLYARTDCDAANTEVACVDDGVGGDTEVLFFPVDRNDVHFIFVDGFGANDADHFVLQLFLIIEQDCNNLIDDDLDGNFDCQDADCAAECVPGNTPTGGACDEPSDCDTQAGNDPFCILQNPFGFPSGSCSEFCDPTAIGACGGDAVCLDIGLTDPFGDPIQESGICVDGCILDTDCRDGYACADLDGLPGGDACFPACDDDAQCPGDFCNADDGNCNPNDEICGVGGQVGNDGVDDDGDTAIDCADLDCEAECAAVACTDAAPLAFTGNIATATDDTTGGQNLLAGSCAFLGITDAPEDIFVITAPGAGTFDAVLTPDPANPVLDGVFYARTTCEDSASEIACADDTGEGEDEAISFGLFGGDQAFVVVDGFATSAGPYTITITFTEAICGDGSVDSPELCDDNNTTAGDGCDATCQVEPGFSCVGEPSVCVELGPLCAAAPTIGEGTTAGDTSNLTTSTSAFEGSCTGGGGAREQLFNFVPSQTGDVVLTLSSATDQGIYVRANCLDANSEVGCVDDQFGGTDETLTVPVTANTPVTIFVDGFFSPLEAGPFTLTVLFPTADEVGLCDDGLDNDQDGLADCADADCAADAACDPDAACAAATAVNAQDSISDDTNNGTNIFSSGAVDPDGNCFGDAGNGRELIFAFTAPAAGDLDLILESASDQGMSIRTTCNDPNSEIACEDQFFGGTNEVINNEPLAAGQTVTIFVDAFSAGDEGPFTLTVDFIAAGVEDCDDAIDNDNDLLADCLDADCDAAPNCIEQGNCDDGIDNDVDLAIDCADADCAADPACTAAADECAAAAAIVEGDTAGNFDASDDNFTGSCNAAATGIGDPEDVFVFTAPSAGTLDLLVVGDVASPVLYVRSSCEDAGTELSCFSDFTDTATATLGAQNTGDQFFVFVEDRFVDGGAYTLTVAFAPATANETGLCDDGADNDLDGALDCNDPDCSGDAVCSETCAAPIDIDETAPVTGNNVGALNINEGSCGANDGGEDVYVFVPSVDGLVSVNVSDDPANLDNIDAILYVRTDCADPASELDCVDDSLGGVTEEEELLALPAIAGEPLFIFVDSFGATGTGGYIINLAFNAVTGTEVGLCDDGVDNDIDNAIDCFDSDCAADVACQGLTPEAEPNGDSTTATPLGAPNAIGIGAINPANELDFYSVDLTIGTIIRFETSDENGLGSCVATDTVVTLFDTDGTTLIDTDDDGAVLGACSLLEFTVPATGTYFIQIEEFDNNAIIDGYQIHVTDITPICGDGIVVPGEDCDDNNFINGDGCSSQCEVETGFVCIGSPSDCTLLITETEANNTAATANSLGAPFTAGFGSLIALDSDFYSVDLTAGTTVRFETSDENGLGSCVATDTVIDLLDTDGATLIDTDDDGSDFGACSRLDFDVPVDGTYFIEISAFLGLIDGYRIHVFIL
jgi:cysteine-rich repeat protein